MKIAATPILLNKNASYFTYDLPHEGLSLEPKLLRESPIKPCGNVNFILKFLKCFQTFGHHCISE